jgi:hypothetical protein
MRKPALPFLDRLSAQIRAVELQQARRRKETSGQNGGCTENLNANLMMMKPAENRM